MYTWPPRSTRGGEQHTTTPPCSAESSTGSAGPSPSPPPPSRRGAPQTAPPSSTPRATRRRRRLFLLLLLLLLLLHRPRPARPHPHYANKIPNGHDVFDARDDGDGAGAGHRLIAALGHVRPSGRGPLNPFGVAFHRAGRAWTRTLCEADSDEDGRSNGAELGDPTCSWKENGDGAEAAGDAETAALSWEEKERARWETNALMTFGLLLTHPGVANDWRMPVRPRPIEVQAARELRRRLARLRPNLTLSAPLVDGIVLVGGQHTDVGGIAQAVVAASTSAHAHQEGAEETGGGVRAHLSRDEQEFSAALAGDGDGDGSVALMVSATGKRLFLLTDRMASVLRAQSTNVVVVKVVPAHPHALAHAHVAAAVLDGVSRHVVTLHRDSWDVAHAAQWIVDTLLAPAAEGECRADDPEDGGDEDDEDDEDLDGDWDGFTED